MLIQNKLLPSVESLTIICNVQSITWGIVFSNYIRLQEESVALYNTHQEGINGTGKKKIKYVTQMYILTTSLNTITNPIFGCFRFQICPVSVCLYHTKMP